MGLTQAVIMCDRLYFFFVQLLTCHSIISEDLTESNLFERSKESSTLFENNKSLFCVKMAYRI